MQLISNTLGDFFNSTSSSLFSITGNIVDGFNNLYTSIFNNITSVITWIQSSTSSIINSVGGFFETIGNNLTDFKNNFIDFVTNILSYINPWSDKFYMKIAIIPSDNYFQNNFNILQTNLNNKLQWFYNLKDEITNIKFTDSQNAMQNIHMTVPLINKDVTVVDFSYLNAHAEFIRTITSAFIYFLIIFYLFKQAALIFGYMS